MGGWLLTPRRALTVAGAAILAETCASRDFGATLAGIDCIRSDQWVDAVTVRPLLAARDAVAGHSIRATEMLKALRQEALRAFRNLGKQGQEARLARHSMTVRFLLNA